MKENMTLSFNREFAKQYGVTAALVYQELYRKYFYWLGQGQLIDGFFWCDQKVMADWLLISRQTLNRVVNQLKEEGLIETETHYKPGTSETTTWWKISNWDSSTQQNVTSCEMSQNVTSHIKADTKADTDGMTSNENRTTKEEMKVAYLKVNPSGRAWKSKKVYTTASEIERLEEMDDEDYIEFKHWMSPGMVGNDSRAKVKRMKVKLVQPDVEEEDTVVHDGKEVKVDKQIYGKVY